MHIMSVHSISNIYTFKKYRIQIRIMCYKYSRSEVQLKPSKKSKTNQTACEAKI